MGDVVGYFDFLSILTSKNTAVAPTMNRRNCFKVNRPTNMKVTSYAALSAVCSYLVRLVFETNPTPICNWNDLERNRRLVGLLRTVPMLSTFTTSSPSRVASIPTAF